MANRYPCQLPRLPIGHRYGRLKEETQNIVGLPEVIFESGYIVKSGRTSLATSLNGTDDFLRTYTRDEWNRVTQLLEEGRKRPVDGTGCEWASGGVSFGGVVGSAGVPSCGGR